MSILLFISLLAGQIGRIQVTPDIALYVHDIVIACYVFFHIPRIWKQRRHVVFLSLNKPVSLFVIICIVSFGMNVYRYTQPDLLVGLLYLIRFFFYALLYVIISIDNKPVLYWIKWIFVLGVCYALFGLLQLVMYPDLRNLAYDGWDPHYVRLFSTLLDPNFMGIILLLSFIVGVYVVTTMKRKRWVLIGMTAILVAFLLTYSRSSYVAAIGAFVTYIGITKKWKLLIVLCVLILTIYFLPSIGGESTFLFRQMTAFARITNWQEGMYNFYESPIIGYGFNMVRAIPHTTPILEGSTIARSAGGYDNSIVFVLVTTGCLGLSAFFYLWGAMIRLGISVGKHSKEKELAIMYLICLGSLVCHSMFLNTLFYPQVMILWWILSGVLERKRSLI